MGTLTCGHEPIADTRACAHCPTPDDWKDHAACASYEGDRELWFADGSHRGVKRARLIAYALFVCAACPVRPYCLQVGWEDRHGVWGGWTADARRDYRERHKPPDVGTIRHLARLTNPT